VIRDELDDDLPAIDADRVQIQQVIMNLLVNAAEGIGEREGEVVVRSEIVHLDEGALLAMSRRGPESVPGSYVCLEVADSGVGIDASTMERIFDPFFSTKFAGRGLGLAAVLGIVREHRGALTVSSEPGRGTTFRIFFPCAGAAARSEENPAVPQDTHMTGRTVLLIDDEEDVRAVTQDMLQRLGCSVLLAGDGREGVDVFRAHANAIDAVIVDLTLPHLRGDCACSEIRRIDGEARVILMSGYDDERTARQLAETGVAAFLRKPFSLADLRSTIDRALRPAY
jgi:CheY-like chemotaxis protein